MKGDEDGMSEKGQRYKAIAKVSDGDRNWDVTIVTAPTFKEAEASAYRFRRQYENTYIKVLWVQVVPA